ncbi:MAG: FAD-binding oxidoreductase [Actinomycetota bacterium]
MAVGWDDDLVVASWPGLAPLADDPIVDACVVGLGASGLTAVEALAERGLSVVGVDAGRVASGAAGRNGGFLLGGGAVGLHHAIEAWGVEAAVGLYRETLRELDRQEAMLGPSIVRRTGSIRLAGLPGAPTDGSEAADREAELADRQDELADCARHAAALHDAGIAMKDYDGELGQGLFLPDDAAVNPARRALALAALLCGRAALHEQTSVTAVGAGRVVTARGTVHAGRVIVAVDGRLDTVLPALAGRVRTARLQMLATAPVPRRVPCPVYCRWGYDYAQQDGAGRLFVGGGRDRFADAEWTSDVEPTRQVQEWIAQLANRLAGRQVDVTHRWGASVGFTADGRPLCAEVEDGVVAVGGYNGTGNLVGPIAARAAVALALDGTPPPSYLAGTMAR